MSLMLYSHVFAAMKKDALEMCKKVYPSEEVTPFPANQRHKKEAKWLHEYQKLKEDANFEEFHEGGDSELEEDHTPLLSLQRDKTKWKSSFSYGMKALCVSLYE